MRGEDDEIVSILNGEVQGDRRMVHNEEVHNYTSCRILPQILQNKKKFEIGCGFSTNECM